MSNTQEETEGESNEDHDTSKVQRAVDESIHRAQERLHSWSDEEIEQTRQEVRDEMALAPAGYECEGLVEDVEDMDLMEAKNWYNEIQRYLNSDNPEQEQLGEMLGTGVNLWNIVLLQELIREHHRYGTMVQKLNEQRGRKIL